jgi:hypothetical protein
MELSCPAAKPPYLALTLILVNGGSLAAQVEAVFALET